MRTIRRFFRHDNIGYLFVFPALAYMLFFIVYPVFNNFLLSMQDVTVMTLTKPNKPFIGWDNYARLFQDTVLLSAIINTFVFTVCCLVFQFIIGFLLALFFNQKFSFAKVTRGIMMIPWMVPITVTALIFKFMFTSNVGIINQALMAIHIIDKPVDWLTSTGTAMAAIITANVWIGIPFNMILLSVGLTVIPKDLYESASMDGAGKIKTFFHITLPLLKPTIESVLILGFIYTFKVYDLVYVMTGGGPVNSTHMLSTWSYKLSFELFRYSDGAATANILFVILLVVSIIYLRFSFRNEER